MRVHIAKIHAMLASISTKPVIHVTENVWMGEEARRQLSDAFRGQPVLLNAKAHSVCARKRLF